MNSEALNKGFVLLAWIITLALWAWQGWWFLPALILALHIVEVFLKGIPIGKKAGIKTSQAVLLTLIYGYAWWIPVQKALAKK
jgi:hypothetical protein